MRAVLSGLQERLTGVSLATITLKEFASKWLVKKQSDLEPVSFLSYQSAVNAFVEALPAKTNLGLQYLTPADVAAYRDKYAAKASARTANNRLKVIRTMLQTAWRDGFIVENVAAKVQALKTEASTRRPFTLPELRQLLSVATGEWRGMVLVGIYTGQRLKDIATLRWSNIDLGRGEIALTTSKTRRRQIIPVAKPLSAYLTELPTSDNPSAPVFPRANAYVQKDGDWKRIADSCL